MVTKDGQTTKATLFVQFRGADGRLRLRKEKALTLRDGQPIDGGTFRAVDWDGDGLIDLFDGEGIRVFRNCGTKHDPVFEPPLVLKCFGEPIKINWHGPHAWVGDLDGDGKPGVIACTEWSVYPFYRHAALMMKSRPKIELGRLETIPTGR